MKLSEAITADNWIPHGRTEEWTRGRGCLYFHLCRTVGDTTDHVTRLDQAIRELYPERVPDSYAIEAFNDHPDTRVEDVIRVAKFADL